MFMGLMYWRSCAEDNQYAHPLPWVPILDVETRMVRSLYLPYTHLFSPLSGRGKATASQATLSFNPLRNSLSGERRAASERPTAIRNSAVLPRCHPFICAAV